MRLHLTGLRILFGFLFFGLIISQIGLRQAASAVSTADIALVVIALSLNLPTLVLATIRSAIILNRLGYRPPIELLTATVIVGFVVGSLTPAASGELLRVQTLQSRAGVPMRTSAMLIAFERVISFFLLSLTSVAAAAITFLPWSMAILTICLLLPLTLAPALGARLLNLIPSPSPDSSNLLARFARFMRDVASDLESLLRDRFVLLSVSLISLVMFTIVALQFWLLARAVGANVNLQIAWLSFGVAQAAGLISVLPFGIGVFDGSLTAVLSAFEVSANQGLAIAILIRLAISLPLIVLAAIAYAFLNVPGSSTSKRTLSTEER